MHNRSDLLDYADTSVLKGKGSPLNIKLGGTYMYKKKAKVVIEEDEEQSEVERVTHFQVTEKIVEGLDQLINDKKLQVSKEQKPTFDFDPDDTIAHQMCDNYVDSEFESERPIPEEVPES